MDIRSWYCKGHWRAGALAMTLMASPVLASPDGGVYALRGAVIAGGGVSHAKNACFDLSATIGEPVAGVVAGNGVSIVSGFWALPVAQDQLFRSSFERCAP